MATDDIYDELGGGDDLYEDLSTTPYNGHVPTQPYSQPPPPVVPQPRQGPKPGAAKIIPIRSAPPIPTRAPSTSITMQNQPPQKRKDKEKGKGKKEERKTSPRPVSGAGCGGGVDFNEILRKRQQMNTKKLEDLEKSKKDEDGDGDKQLAPWQLERKKTTPRPQPNQENLKDKGKDEEDVPEFIKKRRSMSYRDDEEDVDVPSLPPVSNRPPPAPKPPKPIKEEDISDNAAIPPVRPKPKPRLAPKPPLSEKPNNHSPPLAPKPKPSPPRRRDSLPKKEPRVTPATEHPSTSPSLERNTKPPVSAPPKPSRDSIPLSSKPPPPLPEELPPPPFKPPPPSESPPSSKAPPPKGSGDSPPSFRPPAPSPPKPEDSPPIIRPPVMRKPPNNSPPVTRLPPKPLEVTLPPSFKPPAPMPPIQSQGEPTPAVHSVLKYRRLPLPAVDLDNPPALPSRNKKPKIPSVAVIAQKLPPPITTESDDEDIYDDTVGVSGGGAEDDQDIYDDTVGVLGENDQDEDQELYDDVATAQQQPPSLPSRPPILHHVPNIGTGPKPPLPYTGPVSLPPVHSPPPSIPVPPIPVGEEEQEEYEEPAGLQFKGNPAISIQRDNDHSGSNNIPPVPPSPRSTLPPPPTPTGTSPSPQGSPTLSRKNLTKEEKKQLKEEEKRLKEQKRLEQQREKERKKREELIAKNRQKTMKAFKDYKLPPNIHENTLFSVEILQDHKASKEHMAVTEGERARVLLITHEKLPRDKYLVEKEDGSVGLVDEIITQRTVYQSTQIQPGGGVGAQNFGYGDEDIYEPIEADQVEDGPPLLPPMNQPKPIPTEDEEPQDVYECLPDN